jgi:DNA/RNA endonuclease YhcR with UshA esterase domain
MLRIIGGAVLAGTMAGCAARAPHIADIRQDPGRYADRRVTVQGTVTSAWQVPFVDYGLYRIQDDSGSLTVISRARRTPARGSRVRVTGIVRDVASFGQSIGTHIQERDVDVLR